MFRFFIFFNDNYYKQQKLYQASYPTDNHYRSHLAVFIINYIFIMLSLF